VCDIGIDCKAVSTGSNKVIVGGHTCTINQECFNTIGSYECKTCNDGFEMSNGQCKDINECKAGISGPQIELEIERVAVVEIIYRYEFKIFCQKVTMEIQVTVKNISMASSLH